MGASQEVQYWRLYVTQFVLSVVVGIPATIIAGIVFLVNGNLVGIIFLALAPLAVWASVFSWRQLKRDKPEGA